jgi:dUTP pyrophosphatase
MIIKLKRMQSGFDNVQLPEYKTAGSSGMDIRAAVNEPLIIQKGTVGLVPTNLSVEIPQGYEIQVRPRSGLALKDGIGILNSPGTIDSDYRGEIQIILINLGQKDFVINRNERIAQIVLSKVEQIKWTVSEELNSTERGPGGFGSTGK